MATTQKFFPTLVQQQKLDDDAAIVSFRGSIGVGKSTWLMFEAIRAVERPNCRVLIPFRYFNSLDLFRENLERFLEGREDFVYKRAENCYFFSNGAEIRFAYVENHAAAVNRFSGYYCNVLLVDQISQQNGRAIDFLHSLVRRSLDGTISPRICMTEYSE